jgi:hypothetical protein
MDILMDSILLLVLDFDTGEFTNRGTFIETHLKLVALGSGTRGHGDPYFRCEDAVGLSTVI